MCFNIWFCIFVGQLTRIYTQYFVYTTQPSMTLRHIADPDKYNVAQPPFKTEEEAIRWVEWHIPFSIKPISPNAKCRFVQVFTSVHAMKVVCKELGRAIFAQQGQKPTPQ